MPSFLEQLTPYMAEATLIGNTNCPVCAFGYAMFKVKIVDSGSIECTLRCELTHLTKKHCHIYVPGSIKYTNHALSTHICSVLERNERRIKIHWNDIAPKSWEIETFTLSELGLVGDALLTTWEPHPYKTGFSTVLS